MTPKQAAELLPVIIAYAAGKVIQCRANIGRPWGDSNHDLSFDEPVCNYRIKPEPTVRPWTLEEIPVGAVVRQRLAGACPTLIVGARTVCPRPTISSTRIPAAILANPQVANPQVADLLSEWEWRWPTSPVNDWRLCGVAE